MARSHPTIIDVAQKAGVSKSTVSRVLQGNGQPVHEETQKAVQKAIQQLGYEHNAVASSLRTERTNMIMLIMPDITNPFWPDVARGLQDTIEKAGYSVVLANSDWDAHREKQFLATARRNRFDAIAINPAAVTEKELSLNRAPIVILGLREDFKNIDMVGSDSYHGTLQALDYLYKLGHRRIGFIRGEHNSGRGQARYNGYTEFLKRGSLPLRPELIVEVPFELESGRKAFTTLMSLKKPPTAIFASNDVLAIGAMQSAAEMGVVIPDDLSIIGMDNIYSSLMTTPALTTMSKSKYEIGKQAADLLLKRINGTAPAKRARIVIPCELIERRSTAPPRR
ncbi:MAG: LacI family DNA-binding transcriptional regulator [Chloroflexota bacterium]